MDPTFLVDTVGGLAPDADRWNSNPATDWVSLKEAKCVLFTVYEGAASSGTVVLTVENASTNSGTGNAGITFHSRQKADPATSYGAMTTGTSVTTAAGGAQLYSLWVNASELDDTKPYVRLVGTEGVDAATDAVVVTQLFGMRHEQLTAQVMTD